MILKQCQILFIHNLKKIVMTHLTKTHINTEELYARIDRAGIPVTATVINQIKSELKCSFLHGEPHFRTAEVEVFLLQRRKFAPGEKEALLSFEESVDLRLGLKLHSVK
jgi:hypothetical protein